MKILYWKKGTPVNKYYNPYDQILPTPATAQDPADPLCDGGIYGAIPCDTTHTTKLMYPCYNYKGSEMPLGCSTADLTRRTHELEATVIVYEDIDCANPNRSLKIVGFAPVTVFNVGEAPDKVVEARIDCNRISPEPTRVADRT